MFNVKLKALREDRHLSQQDLANILRVKQSAVGNWESGTRVPNMETIGKLADFFDVSIDFLMGRTEKKAPDPEQPVSEDEIQNQAARLYNALLAAGYIKEGQELTSRQMDALESFGDILALLFDSDDK